MNLGTDEADDRDLLIFPETWAELLAREAPPREGSSCWGIDLGGAAAMSAISACWPNGRLETLCMFGREPSLDQRSLQDGVGSLYATAKTRGELLISSKRRIPDLVKSLFRRSVTALSAFLVSWLRIRGGLAELQDALEGSRSRASACGC